MQYMSIFEGIVQNFGLPQNSIIQEIMNNYDGESITAYELANMICDKYIENGMCSPLESSILAVSMEKSDRIPVGYKDYSEGRGGCWNITYDEITRTCESVSLREIFNYLEELNNN